MQGNRPPAMSPKELADARLRLREERDANVLPIAMADTCSLLSICLGHAKRHPAIKEGLIKRTDDDAFSMLEWLADPKAKPCTP